MIYSQTILERKERYRNQLAKVLGRVNATYTTKDGLTVQCNIHLLQNAVELRDPNTSTKVHHACVKCVETFFPNIFEGKPDGAAFSDFVCNHESCFNMAIEEGKCVWCSRWYCGEHLSGGCCNGCDNDPSRDGGDDEREAWEKSMRMSGS